jgi:hypothetical protein
MTTEEIRAIAPETIKTLQNTSSPDVEQVLAGVATALLIACSEIAAQVSESRVSLRDRFAMAALQGLMVNNVGRRKDLVETAYFYADGMMEYRLLPETTKEYDPDAEPSDEDIKSQIDKRKAILESPTSDPEKLVWCADCLKEVPRPEYCKVGDNIICELCMPF